MFRWKLVFSVAGCTAFTAGLAGAKTEAAASALAVMSAFFIGSLESLAGVAVTMVIKDQTEIGVAAGVYGSIRSLAGVLASKLVMVIPEAQVWLTRVFSCDILDDLGQQSQLEHCT